jgi:hypothetical protein
MGGMEKSMQEGEMQWHCDVIQGQRHVSGTKGLGAESRADDGDSLAGLEKDFNKDANLYKAGFLQIIARRCELALILPRPAYN